LKGDEAMPPIEVLAYSTTDITRFVDFTVNGVRDEQGNFVPDSEDRLQTGVFAWLHGREIPEARFFSTAPGDPVQMFVSVIQPTEPGASVPWMRLIPGFDALLRTDGLIGLTAADSFATSPVTTTPLDLVKPRPDLNEIFAAGRESIKNIDFSGRSFTKQAFLKALKGEKGTNVQPMLADIAKNSSTKFADAHPEFRAKAATT
jgi:hypothetical protein